MVAVVRLIFTRVAEDYHDWPSNPILHMVNVVNKYWDMIKFGFTTTARSRRAEQGPQNNRSLVSDFSEGNSEMTTTLKRKVFIYIFI